MLNDLSSFSATIEARFDAQWSFDPRTGRYRNEQGRFLSQKAVEALVDGKIATMERSVRRYTKMLAEGSITLDQWQGSMRDAIKAAHIQAAIVGHGGRASMGSGDYGRIGQRLRQEYAYLQNFARDMLEQRMSAPMAMARASLYAQSVRGSFWEGSAMRQEKQGFSLMKRVLDAQAQHCEDCLAYAGRGIVPIGSVPLPGQRCACRARCRCGVQYFRQQAPVSPV